MKYLPALVLLAGLTFATLPTRAATDPKPPLAVLDHDEEAQLIKVRDQVLASHPDLKAEDQKLRAMHETVKNQATPPSATQAAAAKAEWQAYQNKLRTEMLKIDPTLKPIFAKLDQAHSKSTVTAPPAAPVKTDRD